MARIIRPRIIKTNKPAKKLKPFKPPRERTRKHGLAHGSAGRWKTSEPAADFWTVVDPNGIVTYDNLSMTGTFEVNGEVMNSDWMIYHDFGVGGELPQADGWEIKWRQLWYSDSDDADTHTEFTMPSMLVSTVFKQADDMVDGDEVWGYNRKAGSAGRLAGSTNIYIFPTFGWATGALSFYTPTNGLDAWTWWRSYYDKNEAARQRVSAYTAADYLTLDTGEGFGQIYTPEPDYRYLFMFNGFNDGTTSRVMHVKMQLISITTPFVES